MKYLHLSAALLLVLASPPALAQGDLPAERSSLKGIPSFFVDVTVEGPKPITDAFSTSAFIDQVSKRLSAAGLPVRPRAQGPHFHVHVNMMEVEGGLVPFSISTEFFQYARLELSGSSVKVQTWDEAVVGIVSRDRLLLISDSIDGLVDQFATDFIAVNR